MLETEVIGLPKNVFDKVRTAHDLVEVSLQIWQKSCPDEVKQFERGMATAVDTGSGKAMRRYGCVPESLLRIIALKDPQFFYDDHKAKVFFSVYEKAKVRHEARKIMVKR